MNDKPDGERARNMRHVTGITGIEKWRADKFVEEFRRDCYRISIGLMELRVLLDVLAGQARVCPELVPRLWRAVPPQLRDQFATAFREAASPQFRLPMWVRGSPKTLEELEADTDARTDCLRAWAIEFCRCSLPADRKMPNS